MTALGATQTFTKNYLFLAISKNFLFVQFWLPNFTCNVHAHKVWHKKLELNS